MQFMHSKAINSSNYLSRLPQLRRDHSTMDHLITYKEAVGFIKNSHR
jgi:hypothetical protein